MANIKTEEFLKKAKEKNIELNGEQKKSLEGKAELSESDLENVSGGWFWDDIKDTFETAVETVIDTAQNVGEEIGEGLGIIMPDYVECDKCHSTNTYTYHNEIGQPHWKCRNCGAGGHL